MKINIEKQLNRTYRLIYEKKDYKKAEHILKKMLLLDKNQGIIHYRLSYSLMMQNRFKEALDVAELGRKKDPKYPYIYLQTSKLNYWRNNYIEAYKEAEKGFKLSCYEKEFSFLMNDIKEFKKFSDTNYINSVINCDFPNYSDSEDISYKLNNIEKLRTEFEEFLLNYNLSGVENLDEYYINTLEINAKLKDIDKKELYIDRITDILTVEKLGYIDHVENVIIDSEFKHSDIGISIYKGIKDSREKLIKILKTLKFPKGTILVLESNKDGTDHEEIELGSLLGIKLILSKKYFKDYIDNLDKIYSSDIIRKIDETIKKENYGMYFSSELNDACLHLYFYGRAIKKMENEIKNILKHSFKINDYIIERI